jgi:4'-phosphopantetheinyl transferase
LHFEMTTPLLLIEAWPFPLDELALPAFPADEARAAGIADEGRHRRNIQARSALRHVLGLRLALPPRDIVLEIAPGGKPRVSGCEFSISHSGGWLVVVTGAMPVGVDIETQRPRRNVADMAARFFSAQDAAMLCNADDARRDRIFIQQWVAKEAALKAAGVGISLHLHKAECVFDKSAIREVRWDSEQFSIREFSLRDGTPGAVAWQGAGSAEIRWRDPAELNVS